LISEALMLFARHYSPLPRLTLRAIRCANVRFGILPSQSREKLFNSGAGQAGIQCLWLSGAGSRVIAHPCAARDEFIL